MAILHMANYPAMAIADNNLAVITLIAISTIARSVNMQYFLIMQAVMEWN